MSYRVRRVTKMTCAGCGRTQRVIIERRPSGESSISSCPSCGPTQWLALPHIDAGAIIADELLEQQRAYWRDYFDGCDSTRHPLFGRSHPGCEDCADHPLPGDGLQCLCECHRRVAI